MSKLDSNGVVHGGEEDRMSSIPLIFAAIVYGSVALSLYLVTGDAHVGTSYPIAFAIIALIAGVIIDMRYIDAE